MCELPSVSSCVTRKARKEHECCECRQTIEKGQFYEVVTGCWDGVWSEFKTCSDCVAILKECMAEVDDHYHQFGRLRDLVSDAGTLSALLERIKEHREYAQACTYEDHDYAE